MGKRKKDASSPENSESSGSESSDSKTVKKGNEKDDNQHKKNDHEHGRNKTHQSTENSHDRHSSDHHSSESHKERVRDHHKQDRHSHTSQRRRPSRSRSRSQQRSHDEQRYRQERDGSRNSDNRHFQQERHNNRREADSKASRGGHRNRRRSRSFDEANARWGKDIPSESQDSKKTAQEKEKPNFKLSGKLTEETNMYRGVVIKYSEPPEARKPRRRWRLYPFKGDKALQTLYIHRESAYLIGRDRKVVDLPVDHPSCSKQHAALQYRLVPFTRDNGSSGKRVRPYIIDLESANGTFINNKKIESKKYVELLEKDVIKFGFSSREYVLLHENSKDEALDDDVFPEDQDLIEIKKEEPREEPLEAPE